MNKTSKIFVDRPHRRRLIFHEGQINVTPAIREQCSRLQQSRLCRYWFFRCVHHSSDSQCFSVGRITPKILPSPWGIWTPSNTLFIGPTQVTHPNGISICSPVFAGLTNVSDRQTQTDRSRYSVADISSTVYRKRGKTLCRRKRIPGRC